MLREVALDDLGEAGALLEAQLLADEPSVLAQPERARGALHRWLAHFSRRYVQIVEAELALALGRPARALSGRFARLSANPHDR